MKSKSYRRAQRERLKKKRMNRPGWPKDPRYIETPTPCSCPMCGNPRRHLKGKDKLTIQEKRKNEDVE